MHKWLVRIPKVKMPDILKEAIDMQLVNKHYFLLFLLSLFIYQTHSQDTNPADSTNQKKIQAAEKITTLLEQSKSQINKNDSLAIVYNRQAISIASELQDKMLILTCYNHLINIYYELNDFQSAKEEVNQAGNTAIEVINPEAKAYYYFLSGQVFNKLAEYKLAEFYFTKSIDFYQQINNTDSLLIAYQRFAANFRFIHEYDAGAEYAFKALKLAESKNNHEQAAVSKKYLGEIYAEQKKLDIAIEYFFEYLKYCEDVNDSAGIGHALNNIALSYFYKADYQNSIAYSKKSLAIRKLQNNIEGLAENYNNLSLPYYRLENWELSLKYLEKSLEFFREINEQRQIPTILNNIGNLKLKQGFNKEAKNYYSQAYDLHKQNNRLVASFSYHKNLHKAYLAEGEFSKALDHYKKHILYKDSISYEKQQKDLNELNIRYQTEKKEKQIELSRQEIKLLHAEQEIKDIKLSNQRIWLNILAAGITIVLIFLIIISYQIRQKNKANKELVKKNLEIVNSEKQLKESLLEKSRQLSQKNIDIDPSLDLPKYSGSQLSKEQKEVLLTRILESMENKKPYLKKDFTLETFSKTLESSRSYISQIINEELNQNFSNFINEYRIKEARRMLSDPKNKNLTIETMALSVGFGSKSSFNIAFKKYTGITPSFYLRSFN